MHMAKEDSGRLFDLPDDPNKRPSEEVDEQIRQIGEEARKAQAERAARNQADREEPGQSPGWARVDSKEHVRRIVEAAHRKIERDEANRQAEAERRLHGSEEDS